ncbi:hypothetical protein G7046_g8674 [Stylonectria norvegica]|nr:hypothetical protein G7046_g8674 [Stylonectria norvegica]
MPISALPQATVRLLGSSVTLTSPLCLVKELVDNSIDAEATSIQVTISANTVDTILVRDNGNGINVDDFDSLGRRAHTSKLRSFEELQTKGGQTLGFRGEALASANSLATVKVTTKTSADPVASQLLLRPGVGGVQKRQPVSAPVGTTVQALKVFENLPVRKQNALKESRKTISKIKGLLHTYALAVPDVKLSFKVQDEPGQAWSYSPPVSATTLEAILQVFGHALVSQCTRVATQSHSSKPIMSQNLREVTLVGFLPKGDCDFKVVKDKGTFISVDSRPISSTRGIGKKITAILKSYLARKASSPRQLTGPFMQLSIECTPGSYDPNVSTLKDELLFGDESKVLDCFRNLCEDLYGLDQSTFAPERDQGYSKNPVTSPRHSHANVQPPTLEQSLLQQTDSREIPIDIAALPSSDDFPLDDPQLFEDLESDLRKLGSSSAVSAYTSSPSKPIEPIQPRDARDPDLAEVMMRTITKVDLARKESNTSDENSTEGLVRVWVAPRPTSSPTADSPQGFVRPRDPTRTRRSEDISLYLQPRSEEPIEIATDETATSGHTQGPEDSSSCNTWQHDIGRQPLKELTDSELNRMQEETTNFSVSSPEPETLRPHHAPQREILTGLTRRNFGVNADDVVDVERFRGETFSPPPSSPPMRLAPSQRRSRGAPSFPSMLEQQGTLQTPPSSDPPRGEQGLNRPFRLPRMNAQSGTRRPVQGVTSPRNLSSDDQGLRQTRLSFNERSTIFERGDEMRRPGRHDDRTPPRSHAVSGRNTSVLRFNSNKNSTQELPEDSAG